MRTMRSCSVLSLGHLWQNGFVATIIIFHSVLGLRSVEEDAAERFRSCGFEVALPDLYGGRRTESLEEGFQLMDEIGWPVICGRAFEAIQEIRASAILAGFSMGAGVIASLWDKRTESKAVFLFHGLAEIPRNVRPGLRELLFISCVDPHVSTEQNVF